MALFYYSLETGFEKNLAQCVSGGGGEIYMVSKKFKLLYVVLFIVFLFDSFICCWRMKTFEVPQDQFKSVIVSVKYV